MTLSYQKRYKMLKFFTIALTISALSYSIFNVQPAFCDFSLSDFREYSPGSGLSSPFSSNFTGQIPLKKQNLSPEDKEKIRLAREELNQKKLAFSSEEFIKQIKKNKIENIKLMLNAGMSPNTDYFGEYALYYAAKKNKTEIALLLLEKGASPDAGFDSPLFWAVKNNNCELSRALIESGANLNYTDLVSSNNILYTALKNKNIEIAKLLLKSGAKMDKHSAYLIKKKNLFDKLQIPRF